MAATLLGQLVQPLREPPRSASPSEGAGAAIKSSFTAGQIFEVHGDDALPLVCEIGIANFPPKRSGFCRCCGVIRFALGDRGGALCGRADFPHGRRAKRQ